jgi:hypothetical protein
VAPFLAHIRAEAGETGAGPDGPDGPDGALRLAAPGVAFWAPQPGPQARAYGCSADVIGYGGAGGGGKTDLLLGKAFSKHHRSMIFRRQKTDELRAMVDRSREIAPPSARLNETLLTWRGLPRGGMVGFGGLERVEDWKHYRGHGYDFFGFDEATEFLELQVRSLMGWNRTVLPKQEIQTVLCFNPPTSAEGEWIIRFFAPWLDPQHPNPAEPGEHRYFVTVGDEEEEVPSQDPVLVDDEWVYPKSRTFYPAHVEDNPALMASGYVATLQALPEPLRSQVLYGDFTIGRDDDPWQVIPTRWVLAAQNRHRALPPPDEPLDQVGLDVARGGRDKTVLAGRAGLWLGPVVRVPKPTDDGELEDGYYVARTVLGYLAREDSAGALVVVDVIGVGASPFDILRRVEGTRVYPFSGSEKVEATDEDSRRMKFLNWRSFAWWHLRELLDPDNGYLVALPDDPGLRADLCAPRWKPLAANVVQVEEREAIVARLGRSPDAGTACVLAYAPVGLVDRTRSRPVRYRGREGAHAELRAARYGARMTWDGRPSPAGRRDGRANGNGSGRAWR